LSAHLDMMAYIFLASFFAGVLGSMLGLGGGIIVVPFLTLALHVPLRFAIGASIVSVIATSSGAAVAYIHDRITNLRIGMFLEIATTTGAITGAYLAGVISTGALYLIFGAALLYSAVAMMQKRKTELPTGVREHPLAKRLRLSGAYHDQVLDQVVEYKAANVYHGLGMMYVAGCLSGLLGIGSGIFKVMAMDIFMQLPIKVSSATSNFMIGVTAAASAGVYFARGDIPPAIAGPVALGVLAGSLIGTRVMVRLKSSGLRLVFIPVLAAVGLEMMGKGLGL
jgi:uncharacterized membrane protein YfcA